MKRTSYIFASLALAIVLISWGVKGHRAVATIAQHHISDHTSKVIAAFLKGESMADVSTWADETRTNANAPWHYLNLPLGLNHEEFVKTVMESKENVYTAILNNEAILKDKSASFDQKNEALKFLIHLVGDAHQPMHVSRKEDKGGNTIQVRFDDKGMNLHSLWDSGLIDHENLTETQMADGYDKSSSAQIKQWQAEGPMEWLWESYQISSRLYEETKPGQNVDEAYYKKYIPVVHQRIDQAGIRLAGELNKLFNDASIPVIVEKENTPAVATVAKPIELKDINAAIGEEVSVSGKAYTVKDLGNMALVNLGAAYPDQLLTVVLKGSAKDMSNNVEGKTITVSGKVIEYKGKPEIVVIDKDHVKIN